MRLLLVEINPTFCRELRGQFRDHPRWKQIDVIQRPAEDLEAICAEFGLGGIDAVVSGLPMTTFPDPKSNRILRAIHRVLNRGDDTSSSPTP